MSRALLRQERNEHGNQSFLNKIERSNSYMLKERMLMCCRNSGYNPVVSQTDGTT